MAGDARTLLFYVVAFLLPRLLVFVVLVLDERFFLRGERLARAWPRSTRAVAAFGDVVFLFALPIHFARTRGSFASARGVLGIAGGLLLGLVATVVAFFAAGLLLEGLALALGISLPE